jgi:hypothetical protein
MIPASMNDQVNKCANPSGFMTEGSALGGEDGR